MACAYFIFGNTAIDNLFGYSVQQDPPKNTVTALSKLIDDARAGKMSVDMYVLKYTTITDALLKKHAMSRFDQNVRLLEGLSEELQLKVFDYSSEKKWRMLEHDVETLEPEFEEVKKVVLEKAKMLERKKLFIDGLAMRPGYAGSEDLMTRMSSKAASTVPTTVTSPVPALSDRVGELKELKEQVSRLTLTLEGQPRQQSAPSGTLETLLNSTPQWQWDPRCIWCNSVDHVQKGKCEELKKAVEDRLVGFNEKGRIKLMSTGEELPTMYGKGGMKELLRIRTAAKPTAAASSVAASSADVGTITVDKALESLRRDELARITSLDFENRTDDMIDVETNKKRKRGTLDQTQRIRSTIDNSHACPSARMKVCLNDDIKVEGLLDDSSELNIMSKRAFEKLRHPIDCDINWRINGYDVKAEDEIIELKEGDNLLGVCHDVLVDIGGVAVKQHVFVVKHFSSDLILGRP